MFRTNEEHMQGKLFSAINQLPKTGKARLESSWAHSFYQNFFTLIDEELFAPLYSEKKSRPNFPVNILVGLEAIKSGLGWSDEQLYDSFIFDMKVRYALGLYELGEGHFELRTLYNGCSSRIATVLHIYLFISKDFNAYSSVSS